MEGTGSYRTKQREAILEYLIANKHKHIKAEEILDYCRENGNSVGKATVYRYLDKLVEENVIRKFTIDGVSSACYQYGTDDECCNEHYHFKCMKCGDLFHISCDFMNEISEHVMKEHNFIIDSRKTVFYGICGKCRQTSA